MNRFFVFILSTCSLMSSAMAIRTDIKQATENVLSYVRDNQKQAHFLAHYLHAYERCVLLYQIDCFMSAKEHDFKSIDRPFSSWMDRLKLMRQKLDFTLIELLEALDKKINEANQGSSIQAFLELQNLRHIAVKEFKSFVELLRSSFEDTKRIRVSLKCVAVLINQCDWSGRDELRKKLEEACCAFPNLMKQVNSLIQDPDPCMKYWDASSFIGTKDRLNSLSEEFKFSIEELQEISNIFQRRNSSFNFPRDVFEDLHNKTAVFNNEKDFFKGLTKIALRSSIKDYHKEWFYHSLPGRLRYSDLYEMLLKQTTIKCVPSCRGSSQDNQYSSITHSIIGDKNKEHLSLLTEIQLDGTPNKARHFDTDQRIVEKLWSITQDWNDSSRKEYIYYCDDYTLPEAIFPFDVALFSNKVTCSEDTLNSVIQTLKMHSDNCQNFTVPPKDFFNQIELYIRKIVDKSNQQVFLIPRSSGDKEAHRGDIPLGLSYWASLGVVGIIFFDKNESSLVASNRNTWKENECGSYKIVDACPLFLYSFKMGEKRLKDIPPIVMTPSYFLKDNLKFYCSRSEELLKEMKKKKNKKKEEVFKKQKRKKPNKRQQKSNNNFHQVAVAHQDQLDEQQGDLLVHQVGPDEQQGDLLVQEFSQMRVTPKEENYTTFVDGASLFFTQDQDSIWNKSSDGRMIKRIRQRVDSRYMGFMLYINPSVIADSWRGVPSGKQDIYHQLSTLLDGYCHAGERVDINNVDTNELNQKLKSPVYLRQDEYAYLLEGKLVHFDPFLISYNQEKFLKDSSNRYASWGAIRAGCFVYIFNEYGSLKHRFFHEFKEGEQEAQA